MCVVRGAWLQLGRELASLHSERGEELVDGARELLCTCRALVRECGARARKLLGHLRSIRSDVPKIEVGGIEQLQLPRRGIACRQHIGDARTVLLLEPVEEIAPLLDVAQALRIRFDLARVGTRRLRQLGSARKCRVEQLLPFAERGVDAQETRQDLLCLGEPGRVHRFFELARQAAELLGVGETFRLDVQRLVLADFRLGALDFE